MPVEAGGQLARSRTTKVGGMCCRSRLSVSTMVGRPEALEKKI